MVDYIIYDNGKDKLEMSLSTDILLQRIEGIGRNDITIFQTQTTSNQKTNTGYSIASRMITIYGKIIRNIESNRSKLLDVVAPGVTAKLIVCVNGIEYEVEGQPTITPDPLNQRYVQNFSFVFQANRSSWQTVEKQLIQFTNVVKKFKFPKFITGKFYLSQTDESAFRTVVNTGNTSINLDIEFRCKTDLESPELNHVGLGTYILFKGQFYAGDVLRVKTGNDPDVTVERNGEILNGFKYIDLQSDFNMVALPGDNEFRYAALVNQGGLEVNIILPKGERNGI